MQKDNWISPPDTLDLEIRHVDIWRIPLDAATPLDSNLQADSVKWAVSTLSADETERAAHFHFPADRDRFVIAHGSLRDILSRYLNCQPGEITFSVNQYGKTALNGHKLKFNLSHSGGLALVAVTQGQEIGVDVERTRADMEHEEIAARNFSPGEIFELSALPTEQRAAGFFNCWTRKEAYIKAQGQGLSLPLESFDVSLSPAEPAILRDTRPDSQESARWTLLALDVDPQYAAAVAVAGRDLEFRLWNWDR
ncbi:MAG: 4'-phosphopantetheinyl transferase superfamily protein [Anaerolineales bacterium]|nr:4'-phosphopantetheinyl transferase superfamily protein [Anaerolineales bacterium]